MDRPASAKKIAPFIDEYELDPTEFRSGVDDFANFNEFFYGNYFNNVYIYITPFPHLKRYIITLHNCISKAQPYRSIHPFLQVPIY